MLTGRAFRWFEIASFFIATPIADYKRNRQLLGYAHHSNNQNIIKLQYNCARNIPFSTSAYKGNDSYKKCWAKPSHPIHRQVSCIILW